MMSMHEIESLVEYSIWVAAKAQDPNARNLAYSMYRFQDQFDCGYTVLRLRKELVAMGYLFLVKPEQLPQREKEEAQQLLASGQGGFIGESPRTYLEPDTGLACVCAGSPLWTALCEAGVIAGVGAQPVSEMKLADIASLVIRHGVDLLPEDSALLAISMWYQAVPNYFRTPEEQQQMMELLPLIASTEVFDCTENRLYFKLPKQLKRCRPFKQKWLQPYWDYVQAYQQNPGEIIRRIKGALERSDYLRVCELVQKLPQARDMQFYQATAALGYYQKFRQGLDRFSRSDDDIRQLIISAPVNGLMRLPEVCETFSRLGNENPGTWICHFNAALGYLLLEEPQAAWEQVRLAEQFAPGQPEIEQLKESLDKLSK